MPLCVTLRPNKSYLLGLLKVGRKQLFFYDQNMETYHGKVLCVLDFYVHFSRQRQGIGKHLFDEMLTVCTNSGTMQWSRCRRSACRRVRWRWTTRP